MIIQHSDYMTKIAFHAQKKWESLMKILVVSPVVCGSTCGHGGGILSFGQLKRLASNHEIHFIAFFSDINNGLHDPRCVEELKVICETVTLLPLDSKLQKRIFSKLSIFFHFMPKDAAFMMRTVMEKRLAEVVHDVKPDVLLFQFPQMAQYLSKNFQIPSVMDVIDAYSVSAFRLFRTESSLFKSIYLFINWLTWIRYEALYYSRFNKVFTLTEQDRNGLHIFSPEINIDVIPAAVNVPENFISLNSTGLKRILFVGSVLHTPNVDAIKYFLSDIFPLVLKHIPDAEFVVAGKGVDSHFKQFASERVRFLGFVDDIETLYSSSAVVVMPIRFGGGIKIKTIEAMANCCAIISTSIGIEETGAVDQQHVLIADEPVEFADKLIMLLLDDNLRRYLAKNAWTLATKRFSWEARSEKLETLLEQVTGTIP